jgi:hypothetical protein
LDTPLCYAAKVIAVITTGLISEAIYGYNQILCGNVNSTQWLVTPKQEQRMREGLERSNYAAVLTFSKPEIPTKKRGAEWGANTPE